MSILLKSNINKTKLSTSSSNFLKRVLYKTTNNYINTSASNQYSASHKWHVTNNKHETKNYLNNRFKKLNIHNNNYLIRQLTRALNFTNKFEFR